MTAILAQYVTDLRTAKYSPVTISDRLEVLHRLARHIDKPLLDATAADLRAFQATFGHLAPASVDIYTRHVRALYAWALRRHLIVEDPSVELIRPKVQRGRPHPTKPDDLRTIFACTRPGALRMAYVLAAFAGLRRGEICRLHRRDLELGGPTATALISGKGGKERVVPLLSPVVVELYEHGLAGGWVVHGLAGRPYQPERLSTESTHHLHGLGLATTLHSMRHLFATSAARATRDPLFVRDLLGHGSVATTEIYMETSMQDAHARLSRLADAASDFLGGPVVRAVESA